MDAIEKVIEYRSEFVMREIYQIDENNSKVS